MRDDLATVDVVITDPLRGSAMLHHLYEIARRLPVVVKPTRDQDGSAYLYNDDTIVLRTNLPTLQQSFELAHELIHATGHSARIGRIDPVLDFNEHAREECTANVGALLLIVAQGLAEKAHFTYRYPERISGLNRTYGCVRAEESVSYMLGRPHGCTIHQDFRSITITRNII